LRQPIALRALSPLVIFSSFPPFWFPLFVTFHSTPSLISFWFPLLILSLSPHFPKFPLPTPFSLPFPPPEAVTYPQISILSLPPALLLYDSVFGCLTYANQFNLLILMKIIMRSFSTKSTGVIFQRNRSLCTRLFVYTLLSIVLSIKW